MENWSSLSTHTLYRARKGSGWSAWCCSITATSRYTVRQQDPRTDVSRGKCVSRDTVSADKKIFQIISVTVVRPTLTSSRFPGQIYIPTKGHIENARTDGFFELLWRTATSSKSIYGVHSKGIVIANAGSDGCIFTNHRRQSAWRFYKPESETVKLPTRCKEILKFWQSKLENLHPRVSVHYSCGQSLTTISS